MICEQEDTPSSVESKLSERSSLSSSTPEVPMTTPEEMVEAKEEGWAKESSSPSPHKSSELTSSWGTVCKQLQKAASEGVERYASGGNGSLRTNNKRRRSCADISTSPSQSSPSSSSPSNSKNDPESPCKQKRHRRTAAEIDRGFRCTANNCHKAYGTEGALKMHIRIKHPSLASPSTTSRPPMLVNTSVMQMSVPTSNPSTPSSPSVQSPSHNLSADSPSFENTLKLELAQRSTPPLTPPAPSLKKEPPSEDIAQTATPPHSHSPTHPSTSTPTPTLLESWGQPLGTSDLIRYSNIPVLVLKIGTWQKGTLFCGDIIAKFLYDERKFVWEVYAVTTSTTTFFVRMDISFDDVAMLTLDTHQDVALLTLDINRPPTFYHAEIVQHQPVTWRPLPIDISGGDIFVSLYSIFMKNNQYDSYKTHRRHVLQFGKDSVMQPLTHLFKIEPRFQHIRNTALNLYLPQFISPHHQQVGVPHTKITSVTPITTHPNPSLHPNPNPTTTTITTTTTLTTARNNKSKAALSDTQQKDKDAKATPNPNESYNQKIHKLYNKNLNKTQTPPTNNQNYIFFNNIPVLELDPKDEKEFSASLGPQSEFAQSVPQYPAAGPEGGHHCNCGIDCSTSYDCPCIKGLESCGPMCSCANYSCGNPLNDDPHQGLAMSMEMGGSTGLEANGMMLGMAGLGLGMPPVVGMDLASGGKCIFSFRFT